MSGFLLDTNVIAEIRKGSRAIARARSWFDALEADDVVLSVVTIGEIRKGTESVRRRDPRSARTLDRWLRRVVAEHPDRILSIDLTVAEEWGRLNVPDPLPVIDAPRIRPDPPGGTSPMATAALPATARTPSRPQRPRS